MSSHQYVVRVSLRDTQRQADWRAGSWDISPQIQGMSLKRFDFRAQDGDCNTYQAASNGHGHVAEVLNAVASHGYRLVTSDQRHHVYLFEPCSFNAAADGLQAQLAANPARSTDERSPLGPVLLPDIVRVSLKVPNPFSLRDREADWKAGSWDISPQIQGMSLKRFDFRAQDGDCNTYQAASNGHGHVAEVLNAVASHGYRLVTSDQRQHVYLFERSHVDELVHDPARSDDTSFSLSVDSTGSSGECFIQGTMFWGANGRSISVEELRQGSRVMAATGEIINIVRIVRHEGPHNVTMLRTPDASLRTTDTHRAVVQRGADLVPAPVNSIRAGDDLVTSLGIRSLVTAPSTTVESVAAYQIFFIPNLAVESFNADISILTMGSRPTRRHRGHRGNLSSDRISIPATDDGFDD